MDLIGRIRRLHVRDKLSEREIARMTGLSRNTVSKWLRAPVAEAPKYRREARPNKLSAFETALKQALTADARRPKHERRTARALHAEIKAAGYSGGYSAVTDFVRAWRQGEVTCPLGRWLPPEEEPMKKSRFSEEQMVTILREADRTTVPGAHVTAQLISASGIDGMDHGHGKTSNSRTAGSTRLSPASSRASHL